MKKNPIIYDSDQSLNKTVCKNIREKNSYHCLSYVVNEYVFTSRNNIFINVIFEIDIKYIIKIS